MKLDKLKNKRIFDFIVTNPDVVDKEGDVVPGDEITEALDGWLIRGGSINDAHSNRVVGKGLRWEQLPDGKIKARGVIYDDSKVADDVWNKIRTNEYKMVSIGGGSFDKEGNNFGGENLKDLEIMEVSVCREGMHQDADILDVNRVAKSSDGFGLSFGLEKVILNENLDDISKGGNIMTEVKKIEGQYASVQDVQALAAQIQEIREMISAAPETVQEEYAAPVPEEETEKSTGGGIGTSPVNPSEEGGEVKIPLNPDEKREPQGEAGKEGTDESGVAITQKEIKKAVSEELRKMGYVKKGTPSPFVEKASTEVKKTYPALDIVKGKKSINDFVKSSEIDRLQKKIDVIKGFEAYKRGDY